MQASPGGEAPRGTLDRVLDAVELVLWVGLLVFGSAVAWTVFREDRGPTAPAPAATPRDLVEAEQLRVVGQSRAFTFWRQPTTSFAGGRWSEDAQMLAVGTRPGDWIELALPPGTSRRQRLLLFLTRAADYGVVRVALDGKALGSDLDLFSDAGVVPTGALDLGVVELHGDDVLRISVVGTNPLSAPPHYQFGVDGIRLDAP